jgi:hypothetical protein
MCSQTEQLTVLWILFASIVIGNIAVLLALLPNKSRKSKMNFFIKHLALAGKKHYDILILNSQKFLEYSLPLQKIIIGPVFPKLRSYEYRTRQNMR